MIQNTRKAIKYYELAIENAQRMLEFQVNQDERYQEFQRDFCNDGCTVLFHAHVQQFNFYNYSNTEKIDYFKIVDGYIIYDYTNTFDGVKEVANELLDIVKKFYEE